MSDFFPTRPAARPTIYAFASTHPDHGGLLKVGYTEGDPLELMGKAGNDDAIGRPRM